MRKFCPFFFLILITCLDLNHVYGDNRDFQYSDKITEYRVGVTKYSESNIRNGPGEQYKILWKIIKSGVPVKIIHRLDNWYLIMDNESETGWISVNAISTKKKGGIIVRNNSPVCRVPILDMRDCQKIAILEQNVIVKILECSDMWCRISINPTLTGWVGIADIWGAIGKQHKVY